MKTHGRMLDVEGHLPGEGNQRVAIVDDVVTQGTSIQKAIDKVKAHGCEVAKIITLVDRHEGGSDKFRAAGYNFSTILGFTPAGEIIVEYPGLPQMTAAAYLESVQSI